MSEIKKIIPFITKAEGGFSNNKNDNGGATMRGITLSTFKNWRLKHGKEEPDVDDLKHISDDEWCDIVKTMYWNPWKADEIKNQSIANILVDFGFNSGVISAIKWIQAYVLKVPSDGKIGPLSLAKINNANQKELFEDIKDARKEKYNLIVSKNPKQKVFLNGWINRLNIYNYAE